MLDDFLVRALLGGLGVALVAGPLGSFLVWRRMAFFGAAMAHTALLGVALGVLLDIAVNLGIAVVCVAAALLLLALQRRRWLAADTLLSILAHGALALGLVTLALMEGVRIDLMAYLFGDILAVGRADLAWIYGGGAVALTVMAAIWRPLLAATVHDDLARVEGVAVDGVRLVFVLLIALVVALAIKVAGLLLITSLLIVPAAAARRFAATPEVMAGLASAIGCLAVIVGLAASAQWNLPSGPAIVVAAVVLFAVTSSIPVRR